jgi:quercetin dioxygenase-like cupin family protein
MIRCVRLWTDKDGASRFEEGTLHLPGGTPGDAIGPTVPAASVSFRQTAPEDALAWHVAPAHQLVLTLGGTLQFEMRDGTTFVVHPGDALLADDTTGTGHRWRILGHDPWQRAYVILPQGETAGFVAS